MSQPSGDISLAELKRQLDYNPDTGVFTRRIRSGNNVYVGDVAGGKSSRDGYVFISVNNKGYPAHRLAWLYMTGEWLDCLDHIDHVRDNNKFSNLRKATRQENQKNHSMHKDNTSGVCGVTWVKSRGKWQSQINSESKHYSLGRFNDFFEAVCARKSAEIKYNFHPNHGLSA